MKTLPSSSQCIILLKEAGCSEAVIMHSLAVRDLAMKIAKRTFADLQLVEVGALLHDIGRSKTHGITHAIEGGMIAKNLHLPTRVIHIIERHIGAGLTKETAKKLGLPAKDYIPQTLEEKIVAHADNLINNNTTQSVEQEISKALDNGLADYAQRLLKLHQELSTLCGIDINTLI
jgi:uncharacterized protein (TIGR00295 family)